MVLERTQHFSRAQLGLVYVSGAFGFAFQYMAAFLVPLRARELNAPLDQVGLIVGAGAVVPALLSVWSGELADRLGARKTYVLGTLFSGVASVLMALATDYWWLLPGQMVVGFARSTAWVASQAYVANIGREHERATHMGRLSFSTNAGTFVSPLLIGFAANLVGYQGGFVVMGAVTFLFMLMGLLIPEVRVEKTTKKRGKAGGFGTALRLLRLRGIQVVMILTFVRLWNTSAWRPFIPIFLRENGFDNTVISTVLAANSVVSTFTTLWAAWFAKRTSNEVATAIALGLGSIGAALTPWVAWVPAVYLPAFLIGTGVGVSLPLLMASVSSEVPPDQRGLALGLRMSANQGSAAIAPLAIGAIAEPFGLAIALLVGGAFTLSLLGAAMGLNASGRATPAQVT